VALYLADTHTMPAVRSCLNAHPTWMLVRQPYRDRKPGPLATRPALRRALTDAHTGAFDLLLVDRVSQLSRSIDELADVLDIVDAAGAALHSAAEPTVPITTPAQTFLHILGPLRRHRARPDSIDSATDPFDTATPAGRMMVQMLAVFAEFKRATITDRVIKGMERKAARGEESTHRAVTNSDYLLAGLLFCSRCGRRYLGTAANGNKYRCRYYTCFTKQRYGSQPCPADRLPPTDSNRPSSPRCRTPHPQRPHPTWTRRHEPAENRRRMSGH